MAASVALCKHRPFPRPHATAVGRLWTRSFSGGGASAGGDPALYGTTEPPLPAPEVLHCVGLSVEVVPNVGVGSVTYCGAEICRGVSFLYRDEGWGTPPLLLKSSAITRGGRGAAAEQAVSWTSTVRLGGRDVATLDAVVSVGASAGGPVLSVDVRAVILEPCSTSRFGFIVLHPLRDLVGEPVRVIRADGGTDTSVFPILIPPDPVFTDIAGLEHAVRPGSQDTVSFAFSGTDLFEMEDQRQWLDGSYKTYTRPLRQTPLPYPLSPGETVHQSVSISVLGNDPAPAPPPARAPAPASPPEHNREAAVCVHLGGSIPSAAPLPLIGVGVPATHAVATAEALAASTGDGRGQLLAGPQFLWCTLNGDRRLHGSSGYDTLATQLEAYAELQAGRQTQQIVLEVVVPNESRAGADLLAELLPLAEAIRRSGLEPDAVCLLPANHISNSAASNYALPPEAAGPPGVSAYAPDAAGPRFDHVDFDALYAAGRKVFGPDVNLGGGMATAFTELNRRSTYGLPVASLDFVTHTTSAIVHDARDTAVMQTLEALPYVTATAREIVDRGKRTAPEAIQYCLNPVAIGIRSHEFGDRPNPMGVRMPMANADPRSRAMFGASYFVGYLANLGLQSGTRVDAVALGDTLGDRGLVEMVSEGRVKRFPTYHVVQGLARAAGADARLLSAECTAPGAVAALGLQLDGGSGSRQLWLANLTPAPKVVTVVRAKRGTDAPLTPSKVELIEMDGVRAVSAPSSSCGGGTVDIRLAGYGVAILSFEHGATHAE